MKKIKININKFSCPEDEKTIIKRYEKEIINDEGERENILVCDVFLDPLKGVRYDGTNKATASTGAQKMVIKIGESVAAAENNLVEVTLNITDVFGHTFPLKVYIQTVK